MSNRILDAYIATHRADPADAELRIVVRPERLTATTEIKGRLMGPRTPYASTVEIAYPFREVARTDHLLLRVLIPEPSWWTPAAPLLYEGPLELWQDGERVEQIRLRHGIRTVQLLSTGLRLNGKPMPLQGVCAKMLTEDDVRRWHAEGINLVQTPARDEAVDLLRIADRFGLFVLGRIEEAHQWPRWVRACQRYPSFLGCVFPPDVAPHAGNSVSEPGLRGAEAAADWTLPLGRFDFVIVDPGHPASKTLPAIVKIASPSDAPAAADRVLGWIAQSRARSAAE